MKIVFITLFLAQLLHATQQSTSRNLDSLSNYLETHNLAAGGNTKKCFSNYLPQLELAGNAWSTQYNSCMQQATNLTGNAFNKVANMAKMMRAAALGMSSYIGNCLNITDALDFFNCFAKLSKYQLTTMYAISFNASEQALSLTQQLNSIDVKQYLCTNQTEENYELGTARIFTNLDECLLQAGNLTNNTT